VVNAYRIPPSGAATSYLPNNKIIPFFHYKEIDVFTIEAFGPHNEPQRNSSRFYGFYNDKDEFIRLLQKYFIDQSSEGVKQNKPFKINIGDCISLLSKNIPTYIYKNHLGGIWIEIDGMPYHALYGGIRSRLSNGTEDDQLRKLSAYNLLPYGVQLCGTYYLYWISKARNKDLPPIFTHTTITYNKQRLLFAFTGSIVEILVNKLIIIRIQNTAQKL
jgi:hypothetical protein